MTGEWTPTLPVDWPNRITINRNSCWFYHGPIASHARQLLAVAHHADPHRAPCNGDPLCVSPFHSGPLAARRVGGITE